MIKFYTAYTLEVDDAEKAVQEILQQLNIENNLLKNAVGIVTCFADFVDTGVLEAVCNALPFDVAGTTTIVSAAPGQKSNTMLNLLVMTSDDVFFGTGISQPLEGEEEHVLRDAYQQAQKHADKPALMFSFIPLMVNVSADFFVKVLDEASGKVPNFGTLAVDHNEDYSSAFVIHNGKAYRDRCAVILLWGDIKPEFYIGNISDEKISSEKGAVTAARGNQIQRINDMSVLDYLLGIGLAEDGKGGIAGINSFPIMVDFNDGTEPVSRAMFAVTEEGSVVCGASVPAGSSFSIAEFDAQEIKKTTIYTLQKALENKKDGALIMYSCVGRYFAQGLNDMDEVEAVSSIMEKAGMPYLFAYAGGEVCPVHSHKGNAANRVHNNTFIICSL